MTPIDDNRLPIIFLDNASTTPLRKEVLDEMLPYFKENFGNPSSIHSSGKSAKKAIEKARETIASYINANPEEIYFVASGTEANNLPIIGIAKSRVQYNTNRIVTTNVEHSCVLSSVGYLEQEGFEVLTLNVNKNGLIEDQLVQESVSEKTNLVSIIHISNELGSINNISTISQLLSKYEIPFHVDAVQGFGKAVIDVKELDITALSFCSHKIGGPKGVGAVYIKNGTQVRPLVYGGGQERGLKGGTENVPGIVGFGKAVEIISQNQKEESEYVNKLKNSFINKIFQIDSEGLLINSAEKSSPYILSLTFDPKLYNTNSLDAVLFFDKKGIRISNGAACSSGTLTPSHVMLAIGKTWEEADSTIRISFGYSNHLEEIEYTAQVLKEFCSFRRR